MSRHSSLILSATCTIRNITLISKEDTCLHLCQTGETFNYLELRRSSLRWLSWKRCRKLTVTRGKGIIFPIHNKKCSPLADKCITSKSISVEFCFFQRVYSLIHNCARPHHTTSYHMPTSAYHFTTYIL